MSGIGIDANRQYYLMEFDCFVGATSTSTAQATTGVKQFVMDPSGPLLTETMSIKIVSQTNSSVYLNGYVSRISGNIATVYITSVTGAGAYTGWRMTEGTVRYCTGTGYSHDTAPGYYDPCVAQGGVFKGSQSIFGDGKTFGPAQVSVAYVKITNNGKRDRLRRYAFRGRRARVLLINSNDAAYTEAIPFVSGTIEQPVVSNEDVLFRFRDRLAELDRPVQKNKFSGGNILPNGVEGNDTDLKSQFKPVLRGYAWNFSPPQCNTSKWIHQLSAKLIHGIEWIRDGGVVITPGVVRATLADLEANIPSPAHYDWCFTADGSWIRMGSRPVRVLTVAAWEGANPVDRYVGNVMWRTLVEDGGYKGGASWTFDFTAGVMPVGSVFSSSAGREYYDASGTLHTAAANQPRFDHDPVTHAPRGLRLDAGEVSSLSMLLMAGVNVTGFTVVAEVEMPVSTGSNNNVLVVDSGTGVNRVSLYRSGSGQPNSQVVSGSVVQASMVHTSSLSGVIRMGIAAAANNFELSANGSSYSSSVTGVMPLSLTTLRLGTNTSGVNSITGWIRSITWYPRRLTSAELSEVTTPGFNPLVEDIGDFNTADLMAVSAACPYETGFWTGTQETTLKSSMDVLTSGTCVWYTSDRHDKWRLGAIRVPQGTPVKKFKELTGGKDAAIDEFNISSMQLVASNDDGRGLPATRVTLDYHRNYVTQQPTDLGGDPLDVSDPVGGVEFRAMLEQEYLSVSYPSTGQDASLMEVWTIENEMKFTSSLRYKSDALTQVQVLFGIYSVLRDRFKMKVALTDKTIQATDLGSTVQAEMDRFGLDSGKLFMVLGSDPSTDEKSAVLDIWGAAA